VLDVQSASMLCSPMSKTNELTTNLIGTGTMLRRSYRANHFYQSLSLRLLLQVSVTYLECFSVLTSLVELSDSISGSESTDSEPDSDNSDGEKRRDTVHNALHKVKETASSRPTTPDTGIRVPRSPIVWFHSKPATQLGVYSAVFPIVTDPREFDYVKELKAMQDGNQGEKLWTLLMTAGGHFAGIVVRINQMNGQKIKGKHRPAEYEVVLHKTFHRYTSGSRCLPLKTAELTLFTSQPEENKEVLNQRMTTPRAMQRVPVPPCAATESRHSRMIFAA
jgi:hypothetical protein